MISAQLSVNDPLQCCNTILINNYKKRKKYQGLHFINRCIKITFWKIRFESYCKII